MRTFLALIALMFSVTSAADKEPSVDFKFHTVDLSDIPYIYTQLSETGSNSSCAIFAFFPQNSNKSQHVEVQYCIEDKVVGFDWVYIGDVKYRDNDLIQNYLRSNGYEFTFKKMNDVNYIRVVKGNLVSLVTGLLSGSYGLTVKNKIELVSSNFKVKGLELSTHELYSPFYANQ